MDFSLSSSLVGSAVSNPDKLALDLQFATDKTLTARKGPTPVFTRGSTGRFVGSNGLIQSAAINAPRFDHDPVTGVSKGLLMEESRTNTLLQSESFDSASWTGTGKNLTVTADAILSPSGILNADKLTVGATTTTYFVIQTTPSFVSGTAYTVSCFFKADQVTRVALYATTAATFPANAIFDLTGSGSVVQNTFGVASIIQYPNGWYRCQITGTAGASVPTTIRISPVTGTSLNYVGNSIDSFYAWGAQLELGSFPTSYIPTTTTSIARGGDVCNITGTAFTGFYNNTQGTLVTNAAALGFGTPQNPVVSIENGTTQVMRLRYIAVTNKLSSIVSAVGLTPASNYDVANTFYKAALSAGATGADFVINGTQIPDTYTGSVLTADNMKISGSGAGSTNTCVASIRYYRKQLPVSKLQAFTV